ncbi:hypothetical protein ABTQ05_20245, partial [Acinetobacter baumannii]
MKAETAGTSAKLQLAFSASMGSKPGDFPTAGTTNNRAARLCRVPGGDFIARAHPIQKDSRYGEDDQDS